jgi:hypothetical protein
MCLGFFGCGRKFSFEQLGPGHFFVQSAGVPRFIGSYKVGMYHFP